MEIKLNIKDIPLAELPARVRELGLKPFVANQLIQWLYQKRAVSFDEMTNLSHDTRRVLNEKFYISKLTPANELEASDGTKKFAWRLSDGNIIESVLIPSEPYSKVPPSSHITTPLSHHLTTSPPHYLTISPSHHLTRLTLCISTQVGCAMGCTFCRTAGMGFIRNLTQGEIIDQILAQRGRITNVVLMGMGEPLANFDNVVNAVRIMIDSRGMGLSKRHVTISTAGLLPGIEKLAKEKLGIKLAISLNGTTDAARSQIMPINKKYPINDLMNACKKFVKAAGRYRITFEYVMVGDLNDSADDAKRLVKLLSHLPSKVNLIPLNPSPECAHKAPTESDMERFAQFLRNKHIQVNIRASRGREIMAACGQLATPKSS